jgi:formate dehydrogenase major subunit
MAIMQELDTGTPIRTGPATVTLTIDGRKVSVPPGTSVMAAAALIDKPIPKLCATDSVEAFGSCRLCLVEIEGRKGTPASCTTPAEEGMVVHTKTPRIEKLRRGVMELYLSDHPLDGLAPSVDIENEFKTQAVQFGLADTRYGQEGANHLNAAIDASNPYFLFDPTKCIVCSRCVRTCEEIQGTFALTILGRGFGSKVSTSGVDFLSSECVSCGACVQACPTGSLIEKSIVEKGMPDRTVVTTCAYCGVGCAFKAELKGNEVLRMVPYKAGKANEGHSCVKGRFAYGYTTHKDRILKPMVRKQIEDPWREVSWDEALAYAAAEFKRIQARYGRDSVGAISSSRCTNEEVFLVQKLVRVGFGNNNIDTCARVCHSPTGFGLSKTYGTSAGTQDFKSVDKSDVVFIIGANPTDAHPVFASRLKKRLRQGARLIVVDPRRIDLVRSAHVQADYHLPLKPGTNVAILNAMAHVIVTEGLVNEAFVRERCDPANFESWARFVAEGRHSPQAVAAATGVDPQELGEAARLYATGGNAAIYYGLGVTEHSQGSTAVMAIANLAMATGNVGHDGAGVNPLRGQNNVQGSCDMGSFPHEFSGYRHVSDDATREIFERLWGVPLSKEPGLRIPNMMDEAIDGAFKGLFVQGEDIAQSDPDTKHITKALRSMECVIVQDLFLKETARYAHIFLPGASFLEKDGTFINAERRISRVRKAIEPLAGKADWETTIALANAMGVPMNYAHPSEIMDEVAATTPTFSGVSYAKLDELGSIQWPCNDEAPTGTPIMHVDRFVRGKGQFMLTEYVATEERVGPRFPLLLTTGRILSQYNVGAQTRRTSNLTWHDEDLLEIHPFDAEQRGVRDGDLVALKSRTGEVALHAKVTDRMQPGVVYTTFHHAITGVNVVTTDNSDWATNCPEYKVTAVQVRRTNHLSEWQIRDREEAVTHRRIEEPRADAAE